jgi:putative intracellular protease/amidase
MECDKTVYDKPGACPVCGARLVEQKTAEAMLRNHEAGLKVGILIFNGVEIIDYTGPWEVFGAAGFDVFTVAESREPVTTAMGMTVVPRYTLADAPQPDILLVPGGNVHGPNGSAATLKWVADRSAQARHTLSVCNGAFILAHAGLLDGLSATTTFHLLDDLKSEFPKTRVLRDQRFVDNGKIVTAGGLSSGIDGALHVVSKVRGRGIAQEVALGIEYDWRPDAGFARGALAEALIPDLDLDSLGRWTMVSTEGGKDRWEVVATATSELGARGLLEKIGQALADHGKWTSAPASSVSSSGWRFSDPNGRPWTGTLSVEESPGAKGEYTARLNIARAG